MHEKAVTVNLEHSTEESTPDTTRLQESFLFRIVRILILTLTFLLPIKFVSFVSTPESVPLYHFDIISLIVITWPMTLFEILSGITLCLTTLLYWRDKHKSIRKSYLIYSALWLLLSLTSLLGLVHASAPVYADQMLPHIFSLAAYAVTLCLICNQDKNHINAIKIAFLFGTCFAVYAGLRQYFYGFEELRNYIAEQNAKLGKNVIDEQFAIRLKEARVQGDFASCNTYGAFLAALLPFAAVCFWKLGNERVSPPILSRRLLAAIAIGLIGFTLYQTGSRGALVSLMVGVGLLTVSLPMNWKVRISLIAAAVIGLAILITLIVMTGRGGASLGVRLDYWQAAIRMFFRKPLCGTGWGDFFHDYGQLRFWLDKESPHTPHNMILLFASQSGIASLITICALLLYPMHHAIRSIYLREFHWRDSAMWCGFAAPLTLFILIVGTQFDLGFETPAYSAMLIIFSIDALGYSEVNIQFARSWKQYTALLLLAFAFVTVFISVRQFHSERTATILNEELDPRFSQTHPIDYVSNSETIHMLLKQAVVADPHSPFLWAASAKYLYRLGDAQVAMQWMDEAIKRSPERSSFYLDRARMRFMLNGCVINDICREDLARVRALSPKNPDYMVTDEQLLNIKNFQ